jgi:formiminotetrahydrofolate cyclodeaminase
MDSIVLQLGVGGIFAVLVIKMVLDFLRKKDSKSKEQKFFEKIEKSIKNTDRYVEKMYELHNKFDIDGKPIWYFPQSVVETNSRVLEVCQKMLIAINTACDRIEDMGNKIKEIETNNEEIKKDVELIKKDIEYIKKSNH